MNKKAFFLLTIIGAALSSCKKDGKKQISENANPLLETYTTPFGVPPFDILKNEHFKPAILEGIKTHQAEIDAIANNPETPTFDNTLLAMENAGDLLKHCSTVFFNLKSANTNDTLQKIAAETASELSKHNDDIYLNENLFTRVKSVWDSRANIKLNLEQAKILENTYKAFIRSGANLSDQNKEKLRAINSRIALISLKFGDNILAETNAYELVIDKKEDLAGLPQDLITAAAEEAKHRNQEGKWVFTLHNSSIMPFLQYAQNRELRKEIWTAYQNRANNNNEFDNKTNITELANLRREKAVLLGYKSFADYSLEETMAKTPEKVYELLNQLWKPALEIAQKETADIQKLMLADGITEKVTPYDWRYYTEKIRKERFDLEEQELKPYFSLENVQKGVFQVTEKLYGLKFKELKDLPRYHEEVKAYEVTEANGDLVGIVYMDFFPRKSKRGGAWMTSYKKQKIVKGKRIAPVVSIVCNFTKPTTDTPALLTFDETTTFFHEFGHALHGLLSNVEYESLSGTSVSRDFVELPSQVMENWAAEPEVMKVYAKNYNTGTPIPDTLIEKLQKAGTFDQGFATIEYLAASLLDLNYHSQKANITANINDFEKASLQKMGLPESIIPRYRSTYFSHIFAGGYSAGYYSYIWSGVLDTDTFDAFKKTTLFNPELAKSFRKNILEKGGTEEPMILYKRFRGAEPSIEPLLRKRGLSKVPLKL